MLSKNELKYIQSLCHKKQREAEGLFIAEGAKLVDELLQSDYRVKKVYATEEWMALHPAIDTASDTITPDELKKISLLQSPNQVLAIVEQKTANVSDHDQQKMILVTDGIQDPGNFGTIIRIADWFGIETIMASDDTVELYNPKVIQSTMGSFIRVNIQYGSLPDFLESYQHPVFGALLEGRSMYDQTAAQHAALVIGNEGKGIRHEIMPFITNPITIPRIGGAESLNAAVATGILISHLLRG